MSYLIPKYLQIEDSQPKSNVVISNKCFIHSPAGVIPKIIVFWLYWQQDFKWGFIGSGLLIKQRCTKPIRERAGTVFLYGYCISIWYRRSFANCHGGIF